MTIAGLLHFKLCLFTPFLFHSFIKCFQKNFLTSTKTFHHSQHHHIQWGNGEKASQNDETLIVYSQSFSDKRKNVSF